MCKNLVLMLYESSGYLGAGPSPEATDQLVESPSTCGLRLADKHEDVFEPVGLRNPQSRPSQSKYVIDSQAYLFDIVRRGNDIVDISVGPNVSLDRVAEVGEIRTGTPGTVDPGDVANTIELEKPQYHVHITAGKDSTG